MTEPIEQRLHIARPPEVALQARTPLRRKLQLVHQSAEQGEGADTQRKILEAADPQGLHRQGQYLGVARLTVLKAQQLRIGLEELGGTVRLARLMAENQAVVTDARRIAPA